MGLVTWKAEFTSVRIALFLAREMPQWNQLLSLLALLFRGITKGLGHQVRKQHAARKSPLDLVAHPASLQSWGRTELALVRAM